MNQSEASRNTVVVGLQWGDEGKGKIVDLLAANARHVVRFQGGNNAGHTLVVDGQTVILHLIVFLLLTGFLLLNVFLGGTGGLLGMQLSDCFEGNGVERWR